MGWVGVGREGPTAACLRYKVVAHVGGRENGGRGGGVGVGGEGVNGAGIYSYSNLAREYENREGQQ